jgi:hypothetical protein
LEEHIPRNAFSNSFRSASPISFHEQCVGHRKFRVHADELAPVRPDEDHRVGPLPRLHQELLLEHFGVVPEKVGKHLREGQLSEGPPRLRLGEQDVQLVDVPGQQDHLPRGRGKLLEVSGHLVEPLEVAVGRLGELAGDLPPDLRKPLLDPTGNVVQPLKRFSDIS